MANPSIPEQQIPKVEKVVAATATAKPKESPKVSIPPEEKAAPGTPRATLEKIAEGQPVLEATTPAEHMPDREIVQQLLSEANALLLDAQDVRLLLTSLATQAVDSPLGNQMRADTLRMLAEIKPESIPPELAPHVRTMQEKIQTLDLPPEHAEQNALVQTIENFNANHPNEAVPTELINQIKSGKRDSASTLAQLLQSNTPLAADVWKGLTGQEGFTGFAPTPERILQLAELDLTPENMLKAEAIFTTVQNTKEPPATLLDTIQGPIMIGALGLMFLSQIATGENAGGH
jgi:hypothetical protein